MDNYIIPRDGGREDDKPTLSGYLDFKTRMENNDPDLKWTAHEAWRTNLFKPKPAIVHYQDLYWLEKDLEGRTKGAGYECGDVDKFVERIKATKIDPLRHPEYKQVAERQIREIYERWNEVRAAQHAAFVREYPERMRIEIEIRQRRNDGPIQEIDESMFWAKSNIDGARSDQVHQLDEAFDNTLDQTMLSIVERDAQIETSSLRDAFSLLADARDAARTADYGDDFER